jgi:hypothetical protein
MAGNFDQYSIAGKDRRQFETFESLDCVQTVAASYYGSNGGYYGYMGGIVYVYFTSTGVGEITIQLRNIYSTFYGGIAANGGVFDFDSSLIMNISAEVVRPAPLTTVPPGNVIFSTDARQLTLNYFEADTVVAFPANAQLHVQIKFFRDPEDRNQIVGLGDL